MAALLGRPGGRPGFRPGFFLCFGAGAALVTAVALFAETFTALASVFLGFFASNALIIAAAWSRFFLGSQVFSVAANPFHLTRYMCSMLSASMLDSTMASTSHSSAGTLLSAAAAFLAGPRLPLVAVEFCLARQGHET